MDQVIEQVHFGMNLSSRTCPAANGPLRGQVKTQQAQTSSAGKRSVKRKENDMEKALKIVNGPETRAILIALVGGLLLAGCTRDAELTCYGFCSLGTDTQIEGLD